MKLGKFCIFSHSMTTIKPIFLRPVLSVSCISALLGCGGSLEPSATVSLSSPNVSINGSISVSASAAPALKKYDVVDWSVQESPGTGCQIFDYDPPPAEGQCPGGWIVNSHLLGYSPMVMATYHAPAVAGLYHIVATICYGPLVSNVGLTPGTAVSATATITVQ